MLAFTIPHKPISWNKYYTGVHWAKRSALSNEWAWYVREALIKAKIPRTPLRKAVTIEVTAHLKRLIDCDNICLKVVVDGIRHWGLLRDDSPEYVKKIQVQVVRLAKGDERLEIKIG